MPKSADGVNRVNIRVPEDVEKAFDAVVKTIGGTRSGVVTKLMRAYVKRNGTHEFEDTERG